MIKLVIFDWDDVFTLGSTKGYFACYHAALLGVDVHLDPEEEKRRIHAKWGQSHEIELAELLKEHPDKLKAAIKIYEDNLFGTTFVDALSLVPGSDDFLRRIAKRCQVAVASGVHPRVLKDVVMPRFGLDPDMFSEIITAYDLDDPTHAKPHPFIAETLVRNHDVTKDQAVVVGDATNDVLMARNAGIEPIVVLTGHLSRSQAEELGVEHIIPNVTHVEQVLDVLDAATA